MPISNPPILRLSRIIIDRDITLVGFKQEIVPPAPGAVALVVRDHTGTVNRVVIYEDGKIESGEVEVRI